MPTAALAHTLHERAWGAVVVPRTPSLAAHPAPTDAAMYARVQRRSATLKRHTVSKALRESKRKRVLAVSLAPGAPVESPVEIVATSPLTTGQCCAEAVADGNSSTSQTTARFIVVDAAAAVPQRNPER